MIYNDYDPSVMYQDDLYRPPPLSQGRQGGQHYDHDHGPQQYHEGPSSGNPFDDPFFNNFLKGVNCEVNEGVNHHILIQVKNSKKCHSNNNSRSRFPNSRPPLPKLSPVRPQFISRRLRISSLSDNNSHHDNNNNHNNKDLSRNRRRCLHKNKQVASSNQVLGNPHQRDRDNPSGSESLP